MRILVHDIENNRDEWLNERKGKISATKIATVSGMNPYRSALEEWMIDTGKMDDYFDGNEYTELGLHMEPFIAKLFETRTGWKTMPANSLCQHEEIDWAVATPDSYVLNGVVPKSLLECKNTSYHQKKKWSAEEAPLHYHVQLMWQLGVCGLPHGWIGALIGGDPGGFVHPHFEFDQSIWEQLLETGERYLEMVEKDVAPDAGPGDAKLIDELVGARSDATKTLSEIESDEASLIIEEMSGIRDIKKKHDKKAKELDAEIKAHQNNLKVMMGANRIAKLTDGRYLKLNEVNVGPRDGYSYNRLYIKEA